MELSLLLKDLLVRLKRSQGKTNRQSKATMIVHKAMINFFLEMDIFTLIMLYVNIHLEGIDCRNPNLAKCGGEAQHLEKLGIWSPPGLPNVQSPTAGPKTPRIGVFLVSLERS
jgi:hypothetical protein